MFNWKYVEWYKTLVPEAEPYIWPGLDYQQSGGGRKKGSGACNSNIFSSLHCWRPPITCSPFFSSTGSTITGSMNPAAFAGSFHKADVFRQYYSRAQVPRPTHCTPSCITLLSPYYHHTYLLS